MKFELEIAKIDVCDIITASNEEAGCSGGQAGQLKDCPIDGL